MYENEQPLAITLSPNSVPVKSFWVGANIPSPISWPPNKTYINEIVADNFGIQDGFVEINTGTLVNEFPVVETSPSSTIMRTNADRPLFSRLTGDEVTAFALDMELRLIKSFSPTCVLEISSSPTNKIRIQFGADRNVVLDILGKPSEFMLPDTVIESDDSSELLTKKFLLVIDTKLLDIPPIRSGAKANYRITGRMVCGNNAYLMFQTTLATTASTRYAFEAKQDVVA